MEKTPEPKSRYHLLGLRLALIVAGSLLLLVPEPREAQAQIFFAPPIMDKECSPNPVLVGQHLTCTIDVEARPGTAASVDVVTDTFPAGIKPIRARLQVTGAFRQQDPCTVNGNTVTCPGPFSVSNGFLGFNSEATVTIEAIAQQCGTFTNTATAESFGNPLLGLNPFTVTTSEPITVVGCEGPVTQEVEQEAESGDVDLSFEVSNEGDYASQCTPATQFGNTGNFQNAPGFQQFDGEADDFEPDGIEFAFEPELGVECDSTIQQSAAASE